MPIQHVYNDAGEEVAVLVPIDEWEALQRQHEDDRLTPQEAEALDADWKAYQADPDMAKPLEQVKRELLERGA